MYNCLNFNVIHETKDFIEIQFYRGTPLDIRACQWLLDNHKLRVFSPLPEPEGAYICYKELSYGE